MWLLLVHKVTEQLNETLNAKISHVSKISTEKYPIICTHQQTQSNLMEKCKFIPYFSFCLKSFQFFKQIFLMCFLQAQNKNFCLWNLISDRSSGFWCHILSEFILAFNILAHSVNVWRSLANIMNLFEFDKLIK